MDTSLLILMKKNAFGDGNLPLWWACELACRRSNVAIVDDMLSVVDIPEQAQALALIDSCDANLAEAELIMGGMFGQTVDPTRKLTYARRMQPDRPIIHNSPNRS